MIRIVCRETVYHCGEINDPELEARILKYAEETGCNLDEAVRNYAYTEEAHTINYNIWDYVDACDSALKWVEATHFSAEDELQLAEGE